MKVNTNDKSKQWYLLYTTPRAEKKVFIELTKHGFEVFLPLQKKLRIWSDRKKWVETPLFNSYIFVNTSLSYYYELLNINGIVKFVALEKVPVVVRQLDIELIQLMIANYEEIEATPKKLESGSKVQIIAGPLRGQIGELVEYKQKKSVMIDIQTIGYSLLVQLPDNIIRSFK